MKMMLFLASSLAVASLLVPARAQTAPVAPHTPAAAQAKATSAKTAARRAEAYQGPKVVPDSKKLGQKMLQNSRPTDAIITRLDELKTRPAVK